MADKEQIKAQVLSFLKKAGEDMKRVGADVKQETTRLMEELRNPDTQAAARAKLDELGTWAKKTGEDAATMAESAMKKVEEALSNATDFVSDKVGAPKQQARAAAERPAEAPAAPRKAAKKTVGRKTGTGKKKGSESRASTKKTVGRKKG